MNLKYIVSCFVCFGIIYSQCDYWDNYEDCNLDAHGCVWEENLVIEDCNFEQDEISCNNIDECSWDTQITYYSCSNFGSSTACAEYSDYGCSWEFSWGGWMNHGSSCVGGGFQIDNSICNGGTYYIDEGTCMEDTSIECTDMNQLECGNNLDCEWVEDIEIGQCSQFDNSENSCTNYPGECFWDEDITYASCDYPNSGICNSYAGCYWDCSDYGWYCDCDGQQQIVDTECIGQYEIDNSYCQEIVMPECSEMEQSNCEDDISCNWVVDINVGSCYSLTQASCTSNPDCNWSCGMYHGSCAGCCWYECSGGTYQIDNSYCEEVPYIQGDINDDLIINVLDIIQSVNLILYNEYNVIVDMNYDELINVQDIILLINLIL